MKTLVVTCIVLVTALIVWMLIPRIDNTQAVTTYVREHITELSPVKAQLGGTFYVTQVEAEGGAGVVAYEDGHEAYLADFGYGFERDGSVRVERFVVRE